MLQRALYNARWSNCEIEHGEIFSTSRIAIGAACCIQCGICSSRGPCFGPWNRGNPSNY
ncbi:unnamed protein product [Penicillium camemberti]|uniref:Str. FM013 n=1 Tax=Penicillium camemberti (strain FM 013) TaxID=1429867 RepID=A0A0G4PUV5_PENC3|nr:unnamed protein product [Penicillium camemberti]